MLLLVQMLQLMLMMAQLIRLELLIQWPPWWWLLDLWIRGGQVARRDAGARRGKSEISWSGNGGKFDWWMVKNATFESR